MTTTGRQTWEPPFGFTLLKAIIDCKPQGPNISLMKATPNKNVSETHRAGSTPREPTPPEHEIDFALLEESLEKTVWARMQANDDALRLADLLQAAMLRARAKS